MNEQCMLRIKGESFRCKAGVSNKGALPDYLECLGSPCGGNVFTQTAPDKYECNSCGAKYRAKS